MFKKAKPVWLTGRESERNLIAAFFGRLKYKGGTVILAAAASSAYKLYINGIFVCAGPARAAHGFFRADSIDITHKLKQGVNSLMFIVAGYNNGSYEYLKQPSFLLAEVSKDGTPVLVTDTDMPACALPQHMQRVLRYSFQRAFSEVWSLDEDFMQLFFDGPKNCEPLSRVSEKRIVPRSAAIPAFDRIQPVCTGGGSFTVTTEAIRPISLTGADFLNPGEFFESYGQHEVDCHLVHELERLKITDFSPDFSCKSLKAGQYLQYDLGCNLTGFISATVEAREKSTLYIIYDELLDENGQINPFRLNCINCVKWELEKGAYSFDSIEPYVMKHVQVLVAQGQVQIKDIQLIEYANPLADAEFECSDEKLNLIFSAARQTFRQNAVDIFSDCPSRERAGWLCDSFFTARAEKALTGGNRVEHDFLENYLLPEVFPDIPKGMLPMCYPGEHANKQFIPNWAMWFVMQLGDYAVRGGDTVLINALKNRVYELIGYFKQFENELGLLERLDSWVFVDWSKAADFTQDVSFPTNMDYYAMLKAASSLYNDDELNLQAERLRENILRLSYNGEFFTDNALRSKEGLAPTQNTSEACQYYAFFCGVATPQTHPELWRVLTEEFGPSRKEKGLYPNVYPCNAFIGNYLRLEALCKYGMGSKAVEEMYGYSYYMAQRTGTLWEVVTDTASCNHGFASYTAAVLLKEVLGLQGFDQSGEPVISPSDCGVKWVKARVPHNGRMVDISWSKD